MNNRRNYYRILHVQPEAPLEIIKASYRSLMTKLKAHPDLGGDHAVAVLINQAYAVLSDPVRRRRYDTTLQARGGTPMATPAARPAGRASAYDTVRPRPAQSDHCPFCGGVHDAPGAARSRCSTCGTPLGVPIADSRASSELFGRRTAPRIARSGDLVVYPQWPHPGARARLRDLSLTGLSFTCGSIARSGQLIKIESSFVAGLARVASVRTEQGRCTVHAALLSAEFASSRGAFVHDHA